MDAVDGEVSKYARSMGPNESMPLVSQGANEGRMTADQKIIGEKIMPFIIAEVGSNWKSLDDCMKSIQLAKACGADAVKFQAYSHESLYGFSFEEWKERKTQEIIKNQKLTGFVQFNAPEIEGVLPIDWLPKLAEKAKAVGIEFMCSAFSPELLDAVNPFVEKHKIASSEMCHIGMLDKINSYKKPVIISTGAQSDADIKRVLDYINVECVPLYCVPEYPARSVDFDELARLKDEFPQFEWGYSDHTTDAIEIPRRAAKLGAIVIEKHVNFVGVTSPDSPHSLSGDEFMTMTKAINGLDYGKYVSKGEDQIILRHKRRVIATRDINAHERLVLGENFGIYRSLKDDMVAAHPFHAPQMNGKKLKCDVKAGDGIALGDVV